MSIFFRLRSSSFDSKPETANDASPAEELEAAREAVKEAWFAEMHALAQLAVDTSDCDAVDTHELAVRIHASARLRVKRLEAAVYAQPARRTA